MPTRLGPRDHSGGSPTHPWPEPTLQIAGVAHPRIEVVGEKSRELVYALRIRPPEFQPYVFASGS